MSIKRTFLILFLSVVVALAAYALFYYSSTRKDIDGDGVKEVVKEISLPDGRSYLYVIEKDGTMYKTEYDIKGIQKHKWMLVPDPQREEEYVIYVWDGKTESWLPDQNQDGIPDENLDTH